MSKFNQEMIDIHTKSNYLIPKEDWGKEDYDSMFNYIRNSYLIQDSNSILFIINPEWIGDIPWKPFKRTLQLKCRNCDCYGYWEDIADEDDDFEYGMCSDCEIPKSKKLKKKYIVSDDEKNIVIKKGDKYFLQPLTFDKDCEDCGETQLEEHICDCGLCSNPSKPHRCCECSD